MEKLQENKGTFLIVVPKDYIRLKKWSAQEDFIWTINDEGDLVLREVKK